MYFGDSVYGLAFISIPHEPVIPLQGTCPSETLISYAQGHVYKNVHKQHYFHHEI